MRLPGSRQVVDNGGIKEARRKIIPDALANFVGEAVAHLSLETLT